MTRKKDYLVIFLVILLAMVAGSFDFPQYFNRGADFIKEKIKISLPKMPEVSFRLGLDLQGGTHLVYEADLSNIKGEDHKSSMQGLRDVIERRVNVFGVSEPSIQTSKAGENLRIIVELPGIKNIAEAKFAGDLDETLVNLGVSEDQILLAKGEYFQIPIKKNGLIL